MDRVAVRGWIALAGWLALVGLAPAARAAEAGRPTLVVIVSIDQLRRDRLDRELPGGLGRLAREGQVHTEGVLDHAVTATCPGHLSIVGGRHPGPSGIPGNDYVDRETGEHRYCVEDRAPDAAVFGLPPDPDEGRSPRSLRFDTLGDWMKAADRRTRVFSVSGKDRAAITMGGRRPDAAYWLRRSDQPGFTTSRYYADALPDWVRAWNAEGLAGRVPRQWIHLGTAGGVPARPDDFPGESDDRSRTSPHPIADDDPETLADNIYNSPFVDELTLAFARRLVEVEGLGEGPQPDLLAISLSGVDKVGHDHGPFSSESADALRRVDGWLGEFLSWLEQRVGRERLLVVLSADHGVLPLPEWLAETGELTCPVEGGREWLVTLLAGLWWELHVELSPFSWPWPPWMIPAEQLTVNRELARERDVPVERVVAVAERWLEARPGIREAWTREEIERGEDEWARLYRHSLDPDKSGDLIVQFEPTCLPDFDFSGTTHGSPYLYDRAVPIVFWGAGIRARQVGGPAATVDIAPSVATRLGLALPEGLDGHSLLAPAGRGQAGSGPSGVPRR